MDILEEMKEQCRRREVHKCRIREEMGFVVLDEEKEKCVKSEEIERFAMLEESKDLAELMQGSVHVHIGEKKRSLIMGNIYISYIHVYFLLMISLVHSGGRLS